MIAADAQQRSDSPSHVVSVAAAHGTSHLLEGAEGFRLGDDLDHTQVVHIACHCCNTTNALICSKTPDGAWLLRRAPAVPVAAAGNVEYQGNSSSLNTGGDIGEGPSGTTDVDTRATDSEKEREQEGCIRVTVHPALDSSNQEECSTVSEKEGSEGGCSQKNQAGTSPRCAIQQAAPVPAVAAVAAVAIAAPEPKRDATKADRGLRPLARNSNSSTCSSWEGGDTGAGDELASPLGAPAAIQTAPIHEFKQPPVLDREQQTEQGQLREPERQQTSEQLLPQQHPSVARSSSNSSLKSQQIHDGDVVRASVSKEMGHHQRSSSNSPIGKKAYSDGETSRVCPKLATIKELQKPMQKQPPHLETEPQETVEGMRQCSPACKKSATNDSMNNSCSSNDSKKAQQDSAIAAMAPYMLTRECEGDGNCLYRAFSDQVYGTQEHHLFLRRLAVDVMSRCKDIFEAFVDESEGPFERWLQTKRTYGEWADYREMHALLLLFGTPVFVFDEHLHLLQTFEPDAEKRRLPSKEGESLTPFRLMWHGKLGHYTSLHYVKEGFPIARGLTIGKLEAEGLARLVLSASSGFSNCSTADVAPKASRKEPSGTPAGLEEEALAKCLQVSAQELAGIAAEQECILAAIKQQRLQQLLPQTTKIVNELWNEAKKEQEAWTTRVAQGVRGSPLVAPASDPSFHHSMPGRTMERRLPPTANAASAGTAEGGTANFQTYYSSGRAYPEPLPAVVGSPMGVPSGKNGSPTGRDLRQMGGTAGLWREDRPGQTARYERPPQQMRQEQLNVRQQGTPAASPPIVCHSQGPSGPVLISSPVGPALVTTSARGLPATTTPRSFAYTHQFAPHNEFLEQQRHCVRLADGRLVALAPSGALGPVRHVTLQQQRYTGHTPQHVLPARAIAVNGPRQSTNSSSTTQTDDSAPWFVRWMGSGNNSQGR